MCLYGLVGGCDGDGGAGDERFSEDASRFNYTLYRARGIILKWPPGPVYTPRAHADRHSSKAAYENIISVHSKWIRTDSSPPHTYWWLKRTQTHRLFHPHPPPPHLFYTSFLDILPFITYTYIYSYYIYSAKPRPTATHRSTSFRFAGI